jgi:hypothetical protein
LSGSISTSTRSEVFLLAAYTSIVAEVATPSGALSGLVIPSSFPSGLYSSAAERPCTRHHPGRAPPPASHEPSALSNLSTAPPRPRSQANSPNQRADLPRPSPCRISVICARSAHEHHGKLAAHPSSSRKGHSALKPSRARAAGPSATQNAPQAPNAWISRSSRVGGSSWGWLRGKDIAIGAPGGCGSGWRSIGHLGDFLSAGMRQCAQKLCPHGVDTAFWSRP